jgi:hypothetical protein
MRVSALFLAIVLTTACTILPVASATSPSSPVENCLSIAGDDEAAQKACIGEFASNCIEMTPGGETTVGMIRCVDAERFQWEDIRAGVVVALRAIETPSQRALLEASLAEHERWQEARCAYEASVYEGGSLSRVIAAQCFRDAVAEHALYLRNRYSED